MIPGELYRFADLLLLSYYLLVLPLNRRNSNFDLSIQMKGNHHAPFYLNDKFV